jgi:hypothetical protein
MKMYASGLRKLTALLCLAAAGATVSAAGLKGFRGVAWGDDVDTLGPARLVQTDGDVRCYQRERENMMFGEAPLNDVRYCFNRGQLFMVTLEAAAPQEALVRELRDSYGAPTLRSAGFAQWGGKSAATRVELLAQPNTRRTTMHIYSTQHEPQ